MSEQIQFYGDSISGNCYKLQMACAELGRDQTGMSSGFSLLTRVPVIAASCDATSRSMS